MTREIVTSENREKYIDEKLEKKGLKKSHLKEGGEDYGQWGLDRVERRYVPQEYIDATGQERVKYIADMENAEKSHGSGQPIANIYWLKHKKTGEIKPFGDDTAHHAMGVTSASAKKTFSEEWSKSQDQWLSNEAKKYGIKSYKSLGREIANLPNPKLREWLLKGQLTREQVAERLRKTHEKNN